MLRRLPGSRSFGRIAADLRLQFNEVGKDIRLPPQLIGNHRRTGGHGRYHGDMDAAALDRFDERTEIAVAGKQHDLINLFGKLHRVDCDFDVHITFESPTAFTIVKLFGGFRDDGITVVIEPVDQRTDRRKFLIFDDCRIVERTHHCAEVLKFL